MIEGFCRLAGRVFRIVASEALRAPAWLFKVIAQGIGRAASWLYRNADRMEGL